MVVGELVDVTRIGGGATVVLILIWHVSITILTNILLLRVRKSRSVQHQ